MKFRKLIKKISIIPLLTLPIVASSCSIGDDIKREIIKIGQIFDPNNGNDNQNGSPGSKNGSYERNVIGDPKDPALKEHEKNPVSPDENNSNQPQGKDSVANNTTTNNFLKISDKEVYFTTSLSQEQKAKELAKLNSMINTNIDKVKELDRNGEPYLEFVDTQTELIWREHAYLDQRTGAWKYQLGKSGLLNLVHEFKRKIPYGQEIYDLKSISINDYKIINDKVNGLYMPDSRRMFVNGSSVQNKGFSTYEIIGGLMPTIFHEYIHHWVTVYAEIGLIEDPKVSVDKANAKDVTKRQTTEIYYNPGTTAENADHSHGARQFWNSYFSSNFYSLLNFDVNKKAYIKDEVLEKLGATRVKSILLYNNLSLNDIWRLANELQTPEHLRELQTQYMAISPSGSFTTTKSRLKYNFSLTELVPREYTKYAFESYFSMNEENKTLEKMEAGQNSITWFGVRYLETDQYNRVTQVFSPSGNAEDWSHTYLNNFDSQRRQGWFQNGEGVNFYDNSPRFNATVMPNSVFDINKFRTVDSVSTTTSWDGRREIVTTTENPGELPAKKTKNRAVEFYKVFLETMGYGKTISQIYTKNIVSKNDQGLETTNTQYPTLVRFTGYIKTDKKVDGLVVKQNGKIYGQSLFKYSNTFNFFGHKDIDQGAKMQEGEGLNLKVTSERQKQINNRLYPSDAGYTQNYLSYITKDFIEVKDNSTIHLWKDKNNDGVASEDELVQQEITLPTQRAVTTQRSTNATSSKFDKFLVENTNGNITLKAIK
ncbi:hypothetical protein MBVR141_0125 [Mycoplasmopsis bovirhinis]|uniref:MYPU_1760 family metalloprotease n=1 Tax=Mycoplasmopsis bovirhinis TaxID=29553 RepID=UPI000BB9E2BC|nr:hypothetical protein [Mycoplasmopsis bovirhinis]BBA22123.1 hypothetical protein MBVR141_0125 [Mycoplasmopsis bovirhinis]